MERDFDKAFASFFNGCKNISDKFSASNDFRAETDWHFEIGSRYVKVVRKGSVHCFVDKRNGDVLKAASWRAPAKHARGNIFDNSNGLKYMGPYGPAYLR